MCRQPFGCAGGKEKETPGQLPIADGEGKLDRSIDSTIQPFDDSGSDFINAKLTRMFRMTMTDDDDDAGILRDGSFDPPGVCRFVPLRT